MGRKLTPKETQWIKGILGASSVQKIGAGGGPVGQLAKGLEVADLLRRQGSKGAELEAPEPPKPEKPTS